MKQGGITYITDLEDEYGNVNELGLGELANRIHAPSILYDKRGTLIYYDDLEDMLHGSLITVGGGIGSLSSDTAKTKKQSFKCETSFITDGVYINYYLTDFHTNKIGSAFSFSSNSLARLVTCHIVYYNGINKVDHALSLDLTAKSLSYLDTLGNWVSLGTNMDYFTNIYNWGTIKLVVDLNTGKYERAIVFGTEYNMSSLLPRTTINGTSRLVTTSIQMNGRDLSNAISYVDNIIITDNEPPN